MKAKHRELEIAPDVLELLSAPFLAQIEGVVDNPENLCCDCKEPIRGPVTSVVFFRGPGAGVFQLAHPSCLRSGVLFNPSLDRETVRALGRIPAAIARPWLRESKPRALLFFEPCTLGSKGDRDPMQDYAAARGLVPVSGEIEELVAPLGDSLHLQRSAEGLCLRHPGGANVFKNIDAAELERWWAVARADGEALIITGRGLGLTREEPPIEEALRLRPAWGALAAVEES